MGHTAPHEGVSTTPFIPCLRFETQVRSVLQTYWWKDTPFDGVYKQHAVDRIAAAAAAAAGSAANAAMDAHVAATAAAVVVATRPTLNLLTAMAAATVLSCPTKAACLMAATASLPAMHLLSHLHPHCGRLPKFPPPLRARRPFQ